MKTHLLKPAQGNVLWLFAVAARDKLKKLSFSIQKSVSRMSLTL